GDHVGRTIWGLGELIAMRDPFAAEARQLMDDLAPAVTATWPVKSLAYAALGLVAAASLDPARDEDLARLVPALRTWKPASDPAWRWCEPRLTYDSARLAEVLLRVGHHLGDE